MISTIYNNTSNSSSHSPCNKRRCAVTELVIEALKDYLAKTNKGALNAVSSVSIN
jgi:hypothetical protein